MRISTYFAPLALILAVAVAPPPAYSQSTFNPTIPAAGFNVFTKSAIQFTAGSTHGPVATGGDVVLSGSTSIATNYDGYYPNGNGNSANYGLVIGGRVWYGSGGQSLLNRGQVRIGSLTGGNLYQINSTPTQTQVQLAPGALNSTPNIESSSFMPLNSATTGNGLNFQTSFLAFLTYSSIINDYPITHPVSNAISYMSAPRTTGTGTHIFTVTSGKVNYLNISGAQLNAMGTSGIIYRFSQALDSSTVFVINVMSTGTLNWTPATWGGITDASMGDGRYILYNFPGLAKLNITGSNSTIGNILAPETAIFKQAGNNAAGTIIADTFSMQSGQVRYAPFGGMLPGLSTALPLEQLSLSGNVQNNVIKLKWEAPEIRSTSKLFLERSLDGRSFAKHAELASGTTGSWEESAPSGTQSLYYRLRAEGNGNDAHFSGIWRADLGNVKSTLSLSPNPFGNQIRIQNGGAAFTWELLDGYGRIVRAGECSGDCTIRNLDNLTRGSYFFRTKGLSTEINQQIIKQ